MWVKMGEGGINKTCFKKIYIEIKTMEKRVKRKGKGEFLLL